jgi:hypothetical protein
LDAQDIKRQQRAVIQNFKNLSFYPCKKNAWILKL